MKLSITCFLLFLFQFSDAQDYWINYTNTHRVKDVVELDDGFWLGSEGGLCYYNTDTGEETYWNRGNSIIPSNDVNELLYQENGDLWMMTSGGLSLMRDNEIILGPEKMRGLLMESLDNKIIVVNYDSLFIQKEDMEFDAIAYPDYIAGLGGAAIDQETGAIYVFVNNWFAESYLAVWQNEEWTILYSDMVYDSSMAMDQNGTLWLINYSGLQYFEDGSWIVVTEAEILEEFRTPLLYVNHENQILIKNHFECSSLWVWDGVSLERLKYTEGDCPEYDYFIKPSETESDLYYASSLENGFYNFTSDEISEPKRLAQSPILGNYVNNTLHRSDGSRFIIYSKWIQYVENGVWREIPVPDNLDGNILKGFLDTNENLWIYDNTALWSYENEEWTTLPLPTEINENLELVDFGKNGDIWIQSNLNLARYRNGEWKVFKAIHHHITSSIIKDMKVDPENGDLWVTTFQGVRHFDGQTWTSYEPYTYNHTFGMALGNGGAYVRFNQGLHFIKDGEITTIPMPEEGQYHTFGSKLLYDAVEDELYMWGFGILAVYGDSEWTTYKIEDTGLYNGGTNDMSMDLDENVWLSGSGGGICVFNKNGIISLSVEDEDKIDGVSLSMFKVYPTILEQDEFYIEAERSGTYQIKISEVNGRSIYNRMHVLFKDWPELIKFGDGISGVIFVSIRDGLGTSTQKLVRMSE